MRPNEKMHLSMRAALVMLVCLIGIVPIAFAQGIALEGGNTVINEVYQPTASQDGFGDETVSEAIPSVSEEPVFVSVYPFDDADQQDWQDVETLAQTEMEILPSQGGRIDLLGIASLEIPPDALPASRTVLVRLIALDPPLEVVQEHTPLSPVVWVRFRGLSSPVLNQPLQLTIQSPGLASEPSAISLWEEKTADSGASQAVLDDQEATIAITTGGRYWLTAP